MMIRRVEQSFKKRERMRGPTLDIIRLENRIPKCI